MTPSIRVRPARPGLHVPNPERRRLLLPEGELVPSSPYWLRRINAGDVTVIEEATAVEAPRPKPRPKE